ncbi:hypothetical protein FACS1894139_10570 [Planctomycetales bacterium]|nr:hypothetical protein FACS1894107_04410 [Planctomycetales bacterium]GHS98450.1 hypothetical protein FACS1894108_06620 [Planctomycetales bacterium]GHT05896.1 hypothetical protein FACS1894139_10570 [Planctomycetales bacterium]
MINLSFDKNNRAADAARGEKTPSTYNETVIYMKNFPSNNQLAQKLPPRIIDRFPLPLYTAGGWGEIE